MRTQLVPFPRIKPLHPSSCHIFLNALPTESLYALWWTSWTWNNIFSRSRGETTVLDTAPATPPAQNAAMTGSDKKPLIRRVRLWGSSFAMVIGGCDLVFEGRGLWVSTSWATQAFDGCL
jgi:hypothetical protein